jgi:hypothetical protein
MNSFFQSANETISVFAWPMTIISACIMYRDWSRTILWGRLVPSIVFLIGLAGLVIELDSRGYFDKLHAAEFTIVTDKTFKNEEVELDGKEFSHCKFFNVTILFNGGDFSFHDNEVTGVLFKSHDARIDKTFWFLAKLGLLKLPTTDKDGNTIQPGTVWNKWWPPRRDAAFFQTNSGDRLRRGRGRTEPSSGGSP